MTEGNKALAALNRPQDVTFTVPLKLAVIMIALAENETQAMPYGDALVTMKEQVANQLSG